MDIFFCDLCGSRVTSVDLRGGLGLRQDEDTICGRCVELGRGRDWLASHQQVSLPASAGAEASSPSSSSSIDKARDRARTLDKDLVSEPVKPLVIQSEPSTSATEREPDTRKEQRPSDRVRATIPPPAPLPESVAVASAPIPPAAPVQPDFSGLAGSLSALGGDAANLRTITSAADDLTDQDDASHVEVVDEHKETEVDLVGKPATVVSDETKASVPAAQVKPPRSRSTSSAPAVKSVSSRANTAGNRSPSSAANKSPSGKASRKSAVNATASSLRAAKRPGPNKKVTQIILWATVGMVVVSVILIVAALNTPKKYKASSQDPVTVSLSTETIEAIQKAREVARSALRKSPPDRAELEKALAQILGVQPKLLEFEREAKAVKYTQEQVDQTLADAGWSDTQVLIRPINDKLSIIRMSQ